MAADAAPRRIEPSDLTGPVGPPLPCSPSLPSRAEPFPRRSRWSDQRTRGRSGAEPTAGRPLWRAARSLRRCVMRPTRCSTGRQAWPPGPPAPCDGRGLASSFTSMAAGRHCRGRGGVAHLPGCAAPSRASSPAAPFTGRIDLAEAEGLAGTCSPPRPSSSASRPLAGRMADFRGRSRPARAAAPALGRGRGRARLRG